jgi:hypothetical protein
VTAYIHRILDYALGLAVLLLVARFLFLITELPLPDAAVVRLLGWSNRLCAPLEPEFPAWNFPSGRRLETAPLAAIAILGLFVQGLHWLVHRVAYRGPIP